MLNEKYVERLHVFVSVDGNEKLLGVPKINAMWVFKNKYSSCVVLYKKVMALSTLLRSEFQAETSQG